VTLFAADRRLDPETLFARCVHVVPTTGALEVRPAYVKVFSLAICSDLSRKNNIFLIEF
jgi:hypothetical protein